MSQISQNSPDNDYIVGNTLSPSSDDFYQSSSTPKSENSFKSFTKHGSGGSKTMDVNLISGYHTPTNLFTLQCFAKRSQSQTSQRLPFNALLKYDFKKTVWFSRMDKVLFLSDITSISKQQQFFLQSGECGYHLFLNNYGVLSVIYCHKEGNGLNTDTPIAINEIMPKMRVKQLNTKIGVKQVLVVGRKALIDTKGTQNSSHMQSNHPLRANFNQLPSKLFGIYVEDGAKLVFLDQYYSCRNVKHHNNTIVCGGGFILFEAELFMAFASIGFGMYSAKQLENQGVFGTNVISGIRNPVLFLQPIRSRHNSLCWGLVATKYGQMCLIIPENGEFYVENYDSKGIYDVIHRHASKPWSRNVQLSTTV